MREVKFKAVMQRHDGVMYVSDAYSIDNGLSYLFDFENERWDKFLKMITTEERFCKLFPDDDEYLKGWVHIENIQYTGRIDKEGEEIYETDIVEAEWEEINEPSPPNYETEGVWSGIIEYLGSGYMIKQFNNNYNPSLTNCCIKSIKKICNKFENYELLKDDKMKTSNNAPTNRIVREYDE